MVTRDTAWPSGTPCWVDLGVDDIAQAVVLRRCSAGISRTARPRRAVTRMCLTERQAGGGHRAAAGPAGSSAHLDRVHRLRRRGRDRGQDQGGGRAGAGGADGRAGRGPDGGRRRPRRRGVRRLAGPQPHRDRRGQRAGLAVPGTRTSAATWTATRRSTGRCSVTSTATCQLGGSVTPRSSSTARRWAASASSAAASRPRCQPNWAAYFAVADTDAAARRVAEPAARGPGRLGHPVRADGRAQRRPGRDVLVWAAPGRPPAEPGPARAGGQGVPPGPGAPAEVIRSAVRSAVPAPSGRWRPGRRTRIAAPQPAMIHQPTLAGLGEARPAGCRAGRRGRPIPPSPPRARADLAAGGRDRPPPPRPGTTRHARHRGLGDRRVHHPGPDAEHQVAADQPADRGGGGQAGQHETAGDGRRCRRPRAAAGGRGGDDAAGQRREKPVIAASGSMYRPACSGEYPRTSCRYRVLRNRNPPSAAKRADRDHRRAGERGAAEEPQLDQRLAPPRLVDDQAGERGRRQARTAPRISGRSSPRCGASMIP